jgi:hypothetical protein
MRFNIIIPEVSCWFFHFDVFLAFRPEPTLQDRCCHYCQLIWKLFPPSDTRGRAV